MIKMIRKGNWTVNFWSWSQEWIFGIIFYYDSYCIDLTFGLGPLRLWVTKKKRGRFHD